MEENPEIRDKLAKQRTQLAYERTMLAYARTSLGLVGLGILLIKYEPSITTLVIGLFSLLLAAIILIIGLIKYLGRKKYIRND
jgi:putative membrane protein